MITSFKTEELGVGFDFDISLEANQQIYCFIGKNGIGKTQLLENMAKSLIYSHAMFSRNKTYKYADLYQQKHIHDKLKSYYLKLPIELEVNKCKIKNEAHQDLRFARFEHIENNNTYTSFVCDKPIVFIGAKNRGFSKNIDSSNIKILPDKQHRFTDSFERTLSYLNGGGLEQQEIADWFASRLIINPNFVVKNQNKEQEAVTVLQLMDKLEPGLDLVNRREDGGLSLKLMFYEGQLLINDTPLDKLSTGFISIIKIFQEIVAGYSGWTNESNLNEVDGIVFIDEIEPHLHISWQTKIIGVLREFFPHTTFFISTHSPLVLSGLKNGEGYEMIRNGNIVKTKTVTSIESYFLNDIVKEFFNVDLNKEKIDHIDKEKQKKAKQALLDLVNNLQEED
ncbi:AAA family ATPase [Methylomonas rosea]|uniref:ATP-binding protein n=1 Tax=Methylomonas rosea TaxID=2952227 RepID=A0ABT1TTF5_9GAMM|nr:AAA family ATPase [Methylomonas sp. WSC-7]MCQ8117631.1 ATP-binding protein [Methylomonas sp. WSC-7]